MSGTLLQIWVTRKRRVAPVSVPEALAVVGRGLEGDRYFLGKGSFSRWPGSGRSLSFVRQEDLDAATRGSGIDFAHGVHRRNLVTAGVDLRSLAGRQFRIGAALFRGVRECQPCKYLEGLVGDGTFAALRNRGGLRADVIGGGVIRAGDPVEPV